MKTGYSINNHQYTVKTKKVVNVTEINEVAFIPIKEHETQNKITKVMPVHKHVM